ncbi:MAG: hypothetical protein ACOX5L_06395 [Bacteroidales bacterium]|jgi:hypothetical protein
MENKFLTGQLLYGDDFDLPQIEQWYKEEEEAYAHLEGEDMTEDNFEYTNIDKILGFLKFHP